MTGAFRNNATRFTSQHFSSRCVMNLFPMIFNRNSFKIQVGFLLEPQKFQKKELESSKTSFRSLQGKSAHTALKF